ncbi:Olfactory receptor 8K3, partial [Heterocephalus glaber]
MEGPNFTVVTEFILLGITDRPELQAPLFLLFLFVYLTSLLGNLGMIILTQVDPRLQTPMYFFLRHLALTDLGYSTVVGPKMLVNFVVNQNTISYHFCALQLAFFLLFIACELLILSAMSYDRYVAICNPLLYTVIMSQKVCWTLMAISYLYGTFVSLLVTTEVFSLSFCKYNVISHFYCDNLPLLSLACSDTHETEMIILFLSAGPNLTAVTEFILLGITNLPELQAPLFLLFLIIYLTSLLGNLGMIILTQVDPRLQTPMYFFLRHLALTDLGYSTAVGPKMLVNFVVDQNTISYYGCVTQLTVLVALVGSEFFIL